MDLEGQVVLWNRAAEQMFGWKAEEVIGRRHPGIPPAGDAERAALLEMVRNGGRRVVETRRITRDGREIEVILSVTGVSVRGGDVGLTVGILHDATELRAVQHRAAAAEERWRVLVENVEEFAVLALGADGTIVEANHGAGVLFGDADGQLLRKHVSVICTGARTESEELLRRARDRGRAFLETWCSRRDGSRFWADVVVMAVRGGERAEYTVLLRDVSRRKAERDRERAQLQQSAAITAFAQRAARELAPDPIAEAAVEHLAAAMQAEYVDLLTISADRGATLRRAFRWGGTALAPRQVEIASTIYEEAIAGGQPVVRELTERDYERLPHLRELGVRWGAVMPLTIGEAPCTLAAFCAKPLSDIDVYPLQSIGALCEAITARRLAERRLADSEQMLRLSLEQIPAILWAVDREYRFTIVQGGGLRAVGAKPRAGEGRSLREFRDDASRATRAVGRAFEGESLSYLDEERGRTFDTRVEPLRDANGEIVGAICLALDVTERRRGEEELRASREELRRLAARMTHLQEEERRRIAHELHDELGQRLTALRIEAAVLPRKIGERCSAEVSQAVDSMLQLIDDTILTVRRVATELRPAILDHFGLRSALEHELSQFEKRTGIRYELDISPDDVAADDARATTLYRIVQESLTNVTRHADATFVRVTVEEREDALVLEISDNGRGITEEEIASSLSLGLVGMRERALAHGGEATIRATPNGGTTVSVRLPRGVAA